MSPGAMVHRHPGATANLSHLPHPGCPRRVSCQRERMVPQPPALKRPIRLLVADLDGCVTCGRQWSYDAGLFAALQDFALRAGRGEPGVPHLTFNTGRPQPYAECMARVTGVRTSILCEFGLVLWELPSRAVRLHPALGAVDHEAHGRLLAEVQRRAALPGARYAVEVGKVAQVTLIPRRPFTTADLEDECAELAATAGAPMRVDPTHAVISFLPAGHGKGRGLEWLAGETGIPMEEMAGIGDSASDWEFLERVAISFAPANAVAELKERVTVVTESGAGAAMIEVFEALIAANRRLGG